MLPFFRKNILGCFLVLLISGILITLFYFRNSLLYPNEALLQYDKPTNYNEKHIWGKPLKTLFPDISNPKYVSVETASFFLQPDEDVYYLQSKNNTYVFPLFVLGYHHIVNDIIDGQPLAITTCLLTNTPVVYKRTINETELHFGVLGNLYHGNLIMYDKETDSTWIQLTGESVSGKYKHRRLDIGFPLLQTKWKYLQHNKNLLVLQPQMELDFYHSFTKKYQGRTTGVNLLQNVKPKNDLDNYINGIGIVVRDKQMFYPTALIREKKVINDVIDGWHIVLLFNTKDETFNIYRRYVEDKPLNLVFNEKGIRDYETASIWNYEGEAISGRLKGKRLDPLSYRMSYWYSWSSFYPNTKIWQKQLVYK